MRHIIPALFVYIHAVHRLIFPGPKDRPQPAFIMESPMLERSPLKTRQQLCICGNASMHQEDLVLTSGIT